jgi:hypothetical protein
MSEFSDQQPQRSADIASAYRIGEIEVELYKVVFTICDEPDPMKELIPF